MQLITNNPEMALIHAHTKLTKLCTRLEAINLMTGGHCSENPHANFLAEISEDLVEVAESLEHGISTLQLK